MRPRARSGGTSLIRRFLPALLALAVQGVPSAAWADSEVRILTIPEGAEVWLSTVPLGTTTRDGLRLLYERPGTATFSIRKPGYLTVEQTIRVDPSVDVPYRSLAPRRSQTVVVQLQPAPVEATTSPAPTKQPSGEALSRTEGRPTLRIPKVSRPPRLEDFLKGRPREAEAQITDFRQREPGDGVPVSEKTMAYLSYDDKRFYVVLVCEDDPSEVRARMVEREDIASDDHVAVYLDTFYDRRRAYLFAANPLGIQSDVMVTEGQNPDFSFDTLWYSKGQMTPTGYVVWMAIPFRSLRFPSAPDQTWGIALGRFFFRNHEGSFWPYITNRVEGFSQQLATLEGISRVSPGRNLQFIPHAAFSQARSLHPVKPPFTATEWRGGLDVKAVLRDAFALDVAVNPDFSQVESDEPQVTVNQRFEVYFPEKRPFFTENASFFETPVNLFFTRRIVNPGVGVKLTGKAGGWAIGALGTDDRVPATQALATDRPLQRPARIGALRVQREIGRTSTLGLLVTGHGSGPSSNRGLSLDSRLKLNPNLVFTGQIIRTDTRELEGSALSGSGYFGNILYSGRHLTYSGTYERLTPQFRSVMGFIPRVDIRQMEHLAGYLWRPASARVVSLGPSTYYVVNWDSHGQVRDWSAGGDFSVFLSGPTQLKIEHLESFERLAGLGFRKTSTEAAFYTSPAKWLAVSAAYSRGTEINYTPAPGLAPFLGDSANASLELTLRPTPRLRLDQAYVYSRLRTRADAPPPQAAGRSRVFDNHLARWKLNYQFSRPFSLRATVDYYALVPNASLIREDRTSRVTGDLLLAYLVNPGTALHVGYTRQYDDLASASGPPPVRRLPLRATLTSHQLFVKVSYLFRR